MVSGQKWLKWKNNSEFEFRDPNYHIFDTQHAYLIIKNKQFLIAGYCQKNAGYFPVISDSNEKLTLDLNSATQITLYLIPNMPIISLKTNISKLPALAGKMPDGFRPEVA